MKCSERFYLLVHDSKGTISQVSTSLLKADKQNKTRQNKTKQKRKTKTKEQQQNSVFVKKKKGQKWI